MKNVFDRLSPTLQLIVAQLTACGLSLESMLAAGPEALTQRFTSVAHQLKAAGLDLKALLNGDNSSLAKLTDVAGAVEAATKELQTQLAAVQSAKSAAESRLTSFLSQLGIKADELAISPANLAKFGIKEDAEWQKLSAEQQAEKIAAAATAHAVSARVLAQVRELGFDANQLPRSDAGGNGGSTAADLRTQYESLIASGKASEAGAFYLKHEAAMFGKN